MVPQLFAVGGNRSYPEFWAITCDPRYLGYFTPTPVPMYSDFITFRRQGNLHVAMLAKAQAHTSLGVRPGDHYMPL
jgi:hypothetical protein